MRIHNETHRLLSTMEYIEPALKPEEQLSLHAARVTVVEDLEAFERARQLFKAVDNSSL